VDWAHIMAAQGAFGFGIGTDFCDRSILSILSPKHRAYYRSGRLVIKIGPKGALGSHDIRPIHSAPSLGQSIYSDDKPGAGTALLAFLELNRSYAPKSISDDRPSTLFLQQKMSRKYLAERKRKKRIAESRAVSKKTKDF